MQTGVFDSVYLYIYTASIRPQSLTGQPIAYLCCRGDSTSRSLRCHSVQQLAECLLAQAVPPCSQLQCTSI